MATVVLNAVGTYLGGPVGGWIGATIGSYIDSAYLYPALMGTQTIPGQRLEQLKVMTSTEGATIPRIYGRMRASGQVIWATDFKETRTTERVGGKGAGGPSTKVEEYLYSCSFAVALCEGVVASIGRVWADSKLLDMSGVTWRLHQGREDQAVDPLIASIEGETPAYRGVAYVVFEDLPLKAFGNRLPQLNFEIFKVDKDPDALENRLKSVCMIPGSGEFVYATEKVLRRTSLTVTTAENVHGSFGEKTDVEASLDQLDEIAENMANVSLVTSWFGTDLRAGSCEIKPGVEIPNKATIPVEWRVNGLDRTAAYQVSATAGVPNYGGTPSDLAVLEGIAAIKARGWGVTFYPFILMDIPTGNAKPDPYGGSEQKPFPWRGRITCHPAPGRVGSPYGTATAATQVSAFFGTCLPSHFAAGDNTVTYSGPAEWSYRRMVLHYAKLCQMAGGVDAFLIGSELIGLSTVKGAAGAYPTVAALKQLAADVRGILGAGTKIGYAADWTEYNGVKPYDDATGWTFHLDPLWSDANIDFVGIDNYCPLADWRDGSSHVDALAGAPSTYDRGYLQSNIEGGEAFAWYYASPADRASQTRTPITDGLGKPWVYRVKDFRSFWTNQHFNRVAGVEAGSPTGWVPQSKPLWITELGVPAIDKGANQPNVFYDPKSSESAFPYFSSGARDDLIQRRALEAWFSYWDPSAGHNPTSAVYGGPMIPLERASVWCWDARPYPDFPQRSSVWSDAANYTLGHWLNGRLGGSSLASIVQAEFDRVKPGVADTTDLTQAVAGFMVDGVVSARQAIDPLMTVYQFDAVEVGPNIRFVTRGRPSVATIDESELVSTNAEEEDFSLTRGQETELPRSLKWVAIDGNADYQNLSAEARRLTVSADRVSASQFPIVIGSGELQGLADQAIQDQWVMRERGTFTLPPSRLALDPADVVRLTLGGRPYDFRLSAIGDGEARSVEAAATDPSIYGLRYYVDRVQEPPSLPIYGPPEVMLLDIPQIVADLPAQRPYAVAAASPWPGAVAIFRSPTTSGFELATQVTRGGILGATAATFPAGPLHRFDQANALVVDVAGGILTSATESEVFAGANAIAQFVDAELVSPGRDRLTRLLRGQLGSEAAMRSPLAAGARVAVLDSSLTSIPFDLEMRGLPYNWRYGPIGSALSDPAFTGETTAIQSKGLRPYSPDHVRGSRQCLHSAEPASTDSR